ncbi:hypothetical protein CAPTEDRAFT_213697 [Capitella teleta]|uniref:Uncharacterized protein n=1 Tax=Capitella teleta TaxID=283909 RepID=R7VF42_CAPTE|nr:hypothetical protein CAPTEDRAFT_213697 [Capitella teleta]|eukprot:ELU14931.1 hypothetical protein CAPTEDRAFT_213697 [Capitella teleta]
MDKTVLSGVQDERTRDPFRKQHKQGKDETDDEARRVGESTIRQSEAFAKIQFTLLSKTHFLEGKVDTGAQGNLLPMRTYEKILKVATLPTHTSSMRLSTYSGEKIPHIGTVTLDCRKESTSDLTPIEFYVTNSPGPVIFGLPTCVKLGLVTMNLCLEKAGQMDRITARCNRFSYLERRRSYFPGKQAATSLQSSKMLMEGMRSDLNRLSDHMDHIEVQRSDAIVVCYIMTVTTVSPPLLSRYDLWRLCRPPDLRAARARDCIHLPKGNQRILRSQKANVQLANTGGQKFAENKEPESKRIHHCQIATTWKAPIFCIFLLEAQAPSHPWF